MQLRLDHRILILFAALALVFPLEALAAGTVEGKVVFNGRPRRNPLIQMGADPNCLSINAGKKVVQEFVSLNRDKTVDNVFIHITDEVAGGSAPSEPVLIEQEGCIYHPRIAGAMVGQKLKVRNNDSTLHNIHSLSESKNGFNVGQPKAGMEHEFPLRQSEVMLRLKCDVHPWMIGFIGIKSHPYFAVSGDGGSFRIENVPAGTYNLQAWQEKLGTVDQQIEVKDGETVTVELAYGASESAALRPSLPIQDLVIPAE
ncbi:MAG: TonB-dependent receptor [Thermoanaerobaculia bacterium]